MKLDNIKGRTFIVRGGTNTGVYLFEDNSALIIDPGLSGLRPNKMIKLFEENNIDLKYIINTHEHNDHYGSCNQFRKRYENLTVMSSEHAKLYIENPEVFSNYIIGGKTNEFMEEKLRSKSLDKVQIDQTISEGPTILNGEDLGVIDFKGHTSGSIGVLTKDKVLFVGDLLISEDIIRKFDFLFIFDIKSQLESLKKLRDIDFEYLVLGHGKLTITKEYSEELIKINESSIQKYINQTRNHLKEPTTLENLLKKIIKDNNLKNNYKEYHFFKSSLVSLISYLVDNGEVGYLLDDGDLLYYIKTK